MPGFLLRLCCCLLLGMGLGGLTSKAWGAGSGTTLRAHDLQIEMNWKWVGCHDGGYYPIRLKIRNTGPARNLTIEFTPQDDTNRLPKVTREVSLEQNASLETVLLVPMVNIGSYGTVSFREHGRILRNLETTATLSDMGNDQHKLPRLLIVSPRLEDGRKFEEAVTNMTSGSGRGHWYGHSSQEYVEHVTPDTLPASWLAYTGLDILAIPWTTLKRDVAAETQRAIFTWVRSGGQLLVYDVGDQSQELDRLLGWEQQRFAGKQWRTAETGSFRRLSIAADPSDPSTTQPEEVTTEEAWEKSTSTFGLRRLGLGQVFRMKHNPFPGTASDWAWLISAIPSQEQGWANRHGISGRRRNTGFTKFQIPGVAQVPVLSFLVLITLFSIVIGPVNYAYYFRKKQLSMLLLTVPVLAFGSSLLLVGYSTIANGFSVKSRVQSLTILDQSRRETLSISRVAFFAGSAPARGLNFDPATAVFPIIPPNRSQQAWQVNWSDNQQLRSGWLRSRTLTQFLLVTPREQRGRVEFRSGKETPELLNGLEWELGFTLVRDDSNQVWVAESVLPGQSASLRIATQDDFNRFQNFLKDPETGFDGDVTQYDSDPFYYRGYGYNYDPVQSDIYSQSQQERLIKEWLNPRAQEDQLQRTYLSVLPQGPQLDLGLSHTRERGSIHVLLGFFD